MHHGRLVPDLPGGALQVLRCRCTGGLQQHHRAPAQHRLRLLPPPPHHAGRARCHGRPARRKPAQADGGLRGGLQPLCARQPGQRQGARCLQRRSLGAPHHRAGPAAAHVCRQPRGGLQQLRCGHRQCRGAAGLGRQGGAGHAGARPRQHHRPSAPGGWQRRHWQQHVRLWHGGHGRRQPAAVRQSALVLEGARPLLPGASDHPGRAERQRCVVPRPAYGADRLQRQRGLEPHGFHGAALRLLPAHAGAQRPDQLHARRPGREDEGQPHYGGSAPGLGGHRHGEPHALQDRVRAHGQPGQHEPSAGLEHRLGIRHARHQRRELPQPAQLAALEPGQVA